MLGKSRWIELTLSAGLLAAGPAHAFTYEVLFEDTIGRDAVAYGRQTGFLGLSKLILLDGSFKTSGTDTTTYDRLVLNYYRAMQQITLTPNASFRASLPLLVNYEKEEVDQVPLEVKQSTWVESKPKLEFIYATQNALDIVLGLDVYYISKHDEKKEASNFTATSSYEAATTSMGHLAVVKHTGNFDGGFYYKTGAERKRNVTKSNSLDNQSFVVEDRVYDPATIAIFMLGKLNFGQVFGEFAAVEASGGGNRTDRGATVKEDYFRVQAAGFFPLMGSKDLLFESTLIYKSLSYADNRNITMDTIPMVGLQLKLHFNGGVPLFAGLIGVKGNDGQSIPEFNGTYKIFGVGAVAGLQLNL